MARSLHKSEGKEFLSYTPMSSQSTKISFNMQSLENRASHLPFLRKLLKDALHPNEGVNQGRERCRSRARKSSSELVKEASGDWRREIHPALHRGSQVQSRMARRFWGDFIQDDEIENADTNEDTKNDLDNWPEVCSYKYQ